MPVYEYRCLDCRRLARIFVSYADYGKVTPTCPNCQGDKLQRRIGRISLAKSEDSRADSMMDETALGGLDENDPRSLGKFMRQMSQEMGEDLGDEFHEVVGRLESGESPESIEQSMPELGAEMSGGLADD